MAFMTQPPATYLPQISCQGRAASPQIFYQFRSMAFEPLDLNRRSRLTSSVLLLLAGQLRNRASDIFPLNEQRFALLSSTDNSSASVGPHILRRPSVREIFWCNRLCQSSPVTDAQNSWHIQKQAAVTCLVSFRSFRSSAASVDRLQSSKTHSAVPTIALHPTLNPHLPVLGRPFEHLTGQVPHHDRGSDGMLLIQAPWPRSWRTLEPARQN